MYTTVKEIREAMLLFKNTRSCFNVQMPDILAESIIEYIHTHFEVIGKTRTNITAIGLKLGLSDFNSGVTSVYKNCCKQVGVRNKLISKPSKKTVKLEPSKKSTDSVLLPDTKYLNPLINQHLAIANELIKEEEAKLAIYNEMSNLIKGKQNES